MQRFIGKLAFALLTAQAAFAQGGVDWTRLVINKPFEDVRTYGAKCDGTANDNAAFAKMEAAAATQFYIPYTGHACVITIQLLKLYTGPGNIQQNGTLIGGNYANILTYPTPGANPGDFFGWDLKYVPNAKQFIINASAQSGINTDTSYINPGVIPDFIVYTPNAGGSEGLTVVNLISNSGQPVLSVKNTAPFVGKVGQKVIINDTGAQEEVKILASIQTGVSLTFTQNLTLTHAVGEWVSLYKRTLQTPHEVWLTANALGDNIAYFANVNCTKSPIGLQYAQNGACSIINGSVSADADGEYLQTQELDIFDQGFDVGMHGPLIAVRNSLKRSRVTRVNSDSAASGTTLNVYTYSLSELGAGVTFRIGANTVRDETLTVASNNSGAGPITTTTPLRFTHTAAQADWIDTSAYEASWGMADMISNGAGYVDVGIPLNGNYRVGFDTSLANLDQWQAAFTMKLGQCMYMNWTPGSADEAAYRLYSPYDPTGAYTKMCENASTGAVDFFTSGSIAASLRSDLNIFYGAISLNNACVQHTGAGSPNGLVPGSPCDVYYNTLGGAGTTFYVKESGSATSTGWVGK